MKKLIYILPIVLLSASCQKANLVEESPDKSEETSGRNSTEQSDSTTVTPDLDIDGWEGAIDASFTFGGQEQK